MFHPNPARLATRGAILARLAAGGVEADVTGSPGWWRAPNDRWGRHPTLGEVLAAVPQIDLAAHGSGAAAALATLPEAAPAATPTGDSTSAGAVGACACVAPVKRLAKTRGAASPAREKAQPRGSAASCQSDVFVAAQNQYDAPVRADVCSV